MHRFFLTPDHTQGSILTLAHSEAHHALHVLRLRPNARVVVLNGIGQELLCEVQALNRNSVTLKVLERTVMPPLPCRITLVQAVTKAKTMDLIVQKATELGVHCIAPILSERSVSQVEPENAAHKLERWHATMIEAIKQCGSPWLPRILPPQTVQSFISTGERFDLSLIASLQPDARHPREHFQSFSADPRHLPESVCVWVGPEGDFTPAELNAARQAGALPITLGRLVLRSDTAAVYCLSVVNYEMQSPAPPPHAPRS